MTTQQRLDRNNMLRSAANEAITKVLPGDILYVVRPITEEEKDEILETRKFSKVPNATPLKVFNYRSYKPELLYKIIPPNINGYGFIVDPMACISEFPQRRFHDALDSCIDGHYGNVHIPHNVTKHYQWRTIFTSVGTVDDILLLYKIHKNDYFKDY
jgi:hypothetical protein